MTTKPARTLLLLLIPVLQLQTGCYLGHVAWGQLRLLHAREPIETLLADPSTPEELRAKLQVVQATRAYAAEIGLTVDDNYTSYAAWPGDRVVTTLVATRPGEVEPAGFWFPLVGSLPYKGFFDAERAEREAGKLRGKGLDVCVVAVPAYSTLGWFADPVTGPMLRAGEGRLVETLLHELVHASVFVRDQADFNEGVASFVGEEASVRFYAARNDAEAAARRRLDLERGRRLEAELMALRTHIAELYGAEPAGPERNARRASLETAARGRIAALGHADLRLNDACLALAATYTADIPGYTEILATLEGDLPAFVRRVRESADAEDPRAALLGAQDPSR